MSGPRFYRMWTTHEPLTTASGCLSPVLVIPDEVSLHVDEVTTAQSHISLNHSGGWSQLPVAKLLRAPDKRCLKDLDAKGRSRHAKAPIDPFWKRTTPQVSHRHLLMFFILIDPTCVLLPVLGSQAADSESLCPKLYSPLDHFARVGLITRSKPIHWVLIGLSPVKRNIS